MIMSKKIVVISLGIFALMAADLFNRLNYNGTYDSSLSVSNSEQENVRLNFAVIDASLALKGEILEAYNQFKSSQGELIGETGREVMATMTIAEQEKQHGRMSKLYVGNFLIELKAIINNKIDTTFALLSSTDITTGKVTIEKVEVNTEFMGYVFEGHSNTIVILTKNMQRIELTMFEKHEEK